MGPETAWDEGEGDRTREGRLAAHEAFLCRHLPCTGAVFDPAMATVFETFEVVFAERHGHCLPVPRLGTDEVQHLMLHIMRSP